MKTCLDIEVCAAAGVYDIGRGTRLQEDRQPAKGEEDRPETPSLLPAEREDGRKKVADERLDVWHDIEASLTRRSRDKDTTCIHQDRH